MAFDTGGAMSGAASGAMLGSAAGPIGTAVGALAGGAMGGFMSGKKKKTSADTAYSMQPYSGYRPPRIDYTRPDGTKVEYLRPTQDLTQKIITERAQGIGVGYDPARQSAQQALLKSQLDKRAEDEMRMARGGLSAAGLSGNAAARGATEGRVQRDIGRTYGDALNQMAIESLARANQERDVNTARLQALNASNFGQENTAANFDADIWAREQGLGIADRAFNYGMSKDAQARQDAQNEEIASMLLGAGEAMGGPGGAIAALMQKGQGQGLQVPGYSNYDSSMSSSGGGYRQTGPIKRNVAVK